MKSKCTWLVANREVRVCVGKKVNSWVPGSLEE
jgi:hypothetical protein